MLNNRFILSSESSNITIKGGLLHQIDLQEPERVLNYNPSGIDIVMNETTDFDSFEKELLNRIKKQSIISYLWIYIKNKFGSVLTLVISVLIIILIALLSIHGSMSYDLFSGSENTNILNLRGAYLYLLLSLFILLFLVFSPRIILGDYDNLFEWANKRFSTSARIVKRLARELDILVSLNENETKIKLWNPLVAGLNSWSCRQLIPALTKMDVEVEIMIRIDDKENILELIMEAGAGERFSNQPPEKEEKNDGIYPFHLLSSWEKECFHCLLFSSTINLPLFWKQRDASGREVIISKELSERVFHLYEPKLPSGGQEGATFEKFLNRCLFDYAYLGINADNKMQHLVLTQSEMAEVSMKSIMETMTDTVKNNMGSVSDKLSDPMAIVILIGLIGTDKELDTREIDLVQDFIRNVKRTEKYWLINDFWKFISVAKKGSEGEFKLGLLQFMNVETLRDLSFSFVNAGMYANAQEVFDILKNIYPAKIAIEIADLKDSLGEYREALQILLKTDAEWVSSEIIEDRTLILELYLNIAWVIVSGRFDDYMEKGYEYLRKTDNILRKLPNTEDYLVYLTRYYNTKANYHEWEQKYELAIENYETALKLPGTMLRKSSLLSNRGIAERLLGKATEDISMKRQHFITSRSNIQQAVKMKKSIGEKNQIPGTSHNLAETLLEFSSVIEDRDEKVNILKEADLVASSALDVLDELKSRKRLGRLLTERYIANYYLGELGEASEADNIRQALKDWLSEEDKTSYDYSETTHLLKRFGIKVNH